MHGQSLGQSIQDIDSRVLLSSLQTSDIGSVNAGIESQLLLRKAAFHPNPTQIPGHQSSSIHELKRHVSLKEVERYTKGVEQKRLANAAMERVCKPVSPDLQTVVQALGMGTPPHSPCSRREAILPRC
jgi:hypothetical protein